VEQGTICIEPTKINGLLAWPRELKSVKQVRSTLGIFEYHRAFIPGYANIIRPLNNLLKKDAKFEWTEECVQAMEQLTWAVSMNPVLRRPNYQEPFFLEVDASQYTTGVILSQKDECRRLRPVGSISHSFTPAERNYDIHNQELLAIVHGLRTWQHILLSTLHVITVYTNHKNLTYYRHAQRITQQVARYLGELADYHFILVHKPGISNHADHLSRCPDYDTGTSDNEDTVVLPPNLFANTMDMLSLKQEIYEAQKGHDVTVPRDRGSK
jgi:hypothetical protein